MDQSRPRYNLSATTRLTNLRKQSRFWLQISLLRPLLMSEKVPIPPSAAPVPRKGDFCDDTGGKNHIAIESSTALLKDAKLKEILNSDVGIESLLVRLKQSIHLVKEMSTYVKKMTTIEAEHSAQLKKASRTTTELLKRPEVKKGTFQNQLLSIMKSTDRYGDAGITFIDTMHKIHNELMDVVRSMERQRKLIKESAMRHEKNLLDAEREAEKAKAKYDAACEELEKARTADPNRSKLGFKNKSEEELHRRMTIAEVDYQQKVDQCQRTREELVRKLRVEDVRKLQGLILKCDNALSLQLIRFSNIFETLQLNRGFVIAPIKPQNSPTANLSIKEMAGKIDCELDFYNFVCAIPKLKSSLNRPPVVFKKHPTLGVQSPITTPHKPKHGCISGPTDSGSNSGSVPDSVPYPVPGGEHKFSHTPISSHSTMPVPSSFISSGTAKTGPVLSNTMQANLQPQGQPAKASASSSILDSPRASQAFAGIESFASPMSAGQAELGFASPANSARGASQGGKGEPYDPSKHGLAVFGTPLEDLLDHEEGTVPRIVYQCVQAIDNFGLEVEGIYRINGNYDQVAEIKREFDIDAASVDLLRPNNGVNDIHSVASALKQYFQALPDPLLTREFHREFLNAANTQDATRRRDAIHAIINNLPDPNYTTLRYLIFHLFRIQERADINKMDVTNLGIIWGPVLMSTDYQNVGEMAVQSRAIQTILVNAYAIFEAE